MRHFGSADAERIGAEGAVGRGVAVAADDQQAGQRQPLFGADDVDDALARIAEAEEVNVAGPRVGIEIADYRRNLGIGNGAVAAARRHVMIGDAEGQARLRQRAAARPHLREGVKRAFMHIMAIDPEEHGAVLAPRDLVRRPQLVDEGLRLAHARSMCLSASGLVEGT